MGLYDFDTGDPATSSAWPVPGAPAPTSTPEDAVLRIAAAPMLSTVVPYLAARQAAQYDGTLSGQQNATSDAIDARNALFKSATGVALDNPLQGGYQAGAVQRFADANGGQLPDPGNPDHAETLASYRMSAYEAAAQDLADRHPGIVGGGPDGIGTPIADVARAMADRAVQDQADAQANGGGTLATLPAVLAGGFAGSMRDPLNAALLAVPIGGELRAASTFGRIAEGALQSGALNAGLAAIQEPAVQQWRGQRGQETGLLPGLEDVGAAALFGLPFGALHGLVPHGPRAGAAPAAAAVAGDAEAAGHLATLHGPDVLPELHQAVAADAADKVVMADPPPGAKPADAAQSVRDAIRFGEDPDAPLPPMPPTVPEGTTDALARDRLAAAPAGAHPMDALRGDPAAIASALSSDNQDLVTLGRLASLSDEAAQAVRDGVLPDVQAQHVAAMVADPAEHLSVLQAVAAQAPPDEASARAAISAEVQNRSRPAATDALLGQRQQAQQAQARAPRDPQSLFAFLKAAGGIRDEGGDLRSRDYHRQFIGLINKNGLSLDRARELAAEAGYLGADTARAVAETTPNDLLEAISRHPVYSVFDQDRVAERDAKLAVRADNARYQERYDATRADVRSMRAELGEAPDAPFEDAIARLMLEQGMDFDDAAERASMMLPPEAAEEGQAIDEVPFDLPPDEGGSVPPEGSVDAGGGSEGRVSAGGGEGGVRGQAGATERTAAGDQRLVPGVEPVTDRQRLQAAAEKPLRGGDQAPPAGGLFDQGARQQTDLFDMVPLADREDGGDMRLVRPEDIGKDEEPLALPAGVDAGERSTRAPSDAGNDFELRLNNTRTGESAQAIERATLRDALGRYSIARDAGADPLGRVSHTVIGRVLADRVGDIPVYTVDRDTMRLMQQTRPGGKVKAPAVGLFFPSERRILVRADELADPDLASRVLLHEGLHAAYYDAIQHDRATREVIGFLRREATSAVAAAGEDVKAHYGLTDDHEFVAEAFSNPEFQQRLASIEASPALAKAVGLDQAPARRTLWDVFLGGLRRLLGLAPDQHSLLDALTRVISKADEARYPDQVPAGEAPLAMLARTPAEEAEGAERQRRARLAASAAKQIATDIRGYRGPDGRPDIVSAIGRLFENVGHTGYGDVRSRFNALFGGALSDMGDALHAFGRDPLTLQRRNRMLLDDVARAAFGEAADPKAKAFYDAWLKPNERLREQFNEAGGAIGWRKDWGLPQGHDQGAVLRAGLDAWRAFIAPRLDWDRMMHVASADGTFEARPIEPGERGQVLEHVWRSIVMDGWNTREPSRQALGTSLATSRSDPRFLTFKDATSWLDYNRQFGSGNTFDTMMGHTRGLARDVAAMQRLGPNPGATVQWLKQIVDQEGARYLAGDPTTFSPGTFARLGQRLGADGAIAKSVHNGQQLIDALYESARGAGVPHSLLDDGLTMFRNLQTSAKLGSAVALHATVNPVLLSSALAHYGLPVSRMVGDIARSFAGASAREIDAAGMIVGDAMHSLEQGAREAGALDRAAKWSEWLPTVTLHYSGLEGGVQALRRSWFWGASAGIANEIDKPWDFINPRLRRNLLEGFGLTEADWSTMQRAPLYQPQNGGSPFLRWQDIRDVAGLPPGAAETTALKYLGMLHAAMEFAVPSSRWRSTVALQAGTKPGTISRSILQSFAMFKGFIGSATVSYLEALRHELAGSKATGAAAAGGMLIALTAMGTLALQLKTLSNGKDPLSVDPSTPEGRATLEHGLMTSGALGIFGDYLTADQSSYGHSFLSELAGPIITGLADTAGAAKGLLHGNRADMGAAAVKVLRNNTPVLSTHWALRAAYNRILLDQLQFMLDPKAHKSMRDIEARVQKDTGQKFWWRPGDQAPSRFPQTTPGR